MLIAPSFADIFYNNCFKNGMLPIRLDDAAIDDLFARAAKYPRYKLTADLESCRLSDEHGLSMSFEVEPFRRHCLLHGLDDIGLTLEHETEIAAFERRAVWRRFSAIQRPHRSHWKWNPRTTCRRLKSTAIRSLAMLDRFLWTRRIAISSHDW